MTEMAPSEQVDALDAFVSLLSGLDSDPGANSPQFYDCLCEAVCRLTSMRRAALLLYDDARKVVAPVGSHGLAAEMVEQIYGTLDETPLARPRPGSLRWPRPPSRAWALPPRRACRARSTLGATAS